MAEALAAEKAEFDGCGLEMPDLGDEANYRELRFVQNIKLRRYRRKELEGESMESWSPSHNARGILFFQHFVAEMGFLNRKEVIENNDLIISRT